MKSKDKKGREPRKEPHDEVLESARDERERLRLSRIVTDSDRRYAEYYETLDPRQQALLFRP